MKYFVRLKIANIYKEKSYFLRKELFEQFFPKPATYNFLILKLSISRHQNLLVMFSKSFDITR